LKHRTNTSLVPGPSTLIWTSGFAAENCSATSDEIGWTVDEPDTVTVPDIAEGELPPSLPHAAPSTASAENAATAPSLIRPLPIPLPPSRFSPRRSGGGRPEEGCRAALPSTTVGDLGCPSSAASVGMPGGGLLA